MPLVEALNLFNVASLVLFTVLAIVALGRMFWRLGAFIFTGLPVPVLLKRDLILFGALVAFFGSVLIARLLPDEWLEVLNTHVLWVVPRTLLVLAAMVYWVWVEYHLDGEHY